LALLPPPTARAHGEPPEALSVVATDADGPNLVRLNEGLALRTGDAWRYLCPALWSEDAVVPALSIPDGPAVIGAGSGLLLVSPDGAVTRHPDAAATGRVLALAASAGGLFALRQTGDLYQVLRVDADRVDVVFGGIEPWDDLAASDDSLQLVRLEGNQLRELRLSLSGETLAELDAVAPAATVAVLARLAGGVPYALVLTSSLAGEIGRIEGDGWRSFVSGRVLAGPVQTASGSWFVAAEGQLARFDGERSAPLGDTSSVTCLRTHVGLDYACSDRGLRALARAGLAASLFALEELRPPALERVPEAQRDACTLQWQRYEIDLRAAGLRPSAQDAGMAEGVPDASGESDAAQPRADAGDRASHRGGGCAIAAESTSAATVFPLAALALWLGFGRRSRSTRARRTRASPQQSIRRLRTDRPRPCRRRRTS
jgi:hypothetical protein